MSQVDYKKEIDDIRRRIKQLKRMNEDFQQNLKKMQKEEEYCYFELQREKQETDQMAAMNMGDKKLIRILEEKSARLRKATLTREENVHRLSFERKKIMSHSENQLIEWNKKIRRLEESR